MSIDPYRESETHLHMTVEALKDRINQLESLGNWKLISGASGDLSGDRVTLDDLHTIYPTLNELANTNPWHIRGAQLRYSYIFGKRFDLENVRKKERKILDDPHNRSVLFSIDAMESLNLSMFTAGNVVVLFDRVTGRFTRVPIMEITGAITNPDDDTDVWYVRRTWMSRDAQNNDKEENRWFPTARHEQREGRANLRKTIKVDGAESQTVSQTSVAFVKVGKRPEGSTWGVPDSLGAMLWTVAYSEYLSDNSKLVKALSRFAWNITRPDKAAARRTASEIHEAPGNSVGASAVNAGGGISSVGVPSAQVNMNNGQPLIAAVAASFGVPVIALLSSPGATGGSYGAASTLDQPTIKGFEVLQDSWSEFYEEILRYLGSPDALVVFPPIQTDPPHRILAALGIAVSQGLVWKEDASDFAYDLMGIRRSKQGLPPMDSLDTTVPAQGRSNANIPGGVNQGETDHSLDSDG